MTTEPAKKPKPPTRSAPLYQNLVADLRGQIEDGGTLGVGDRLPSIASLCRQHGVSTITVRAALKELVASGYLESRVGSGFYVRARRVPAAAADSANAPGALSPRFHGGERVIAFQLTLTSGNPFFKGLVAGAERECRRQGYRLIVVVSHEDADQEAQQLRELSGQVAGVLVVPAVMDGSYAGYGALMERKVPFVFVDRAVRGLAAPLVSTDNEEGGYLATRHLLSTGVRTVYVVSERPATSLEERIQGYRRALRDAGITPDPAWVREGPLFGDTSGYDLTRNLLAERRERAGDDAPFGLFALQDEIARGSYAALKEAGLRIPADVRVVGFDDLYSLHMDPPLTTVRQDTEGMGASAARVLLKLLAPGTGVTRTPRGVRLPPELVVRSSSDPASTFSLAEHLSRHTRIAVERHRTKESVL
ncbi:MAG TPA: GntR family transcriptional regulator [Armatimonadaceae bacterium]|nr:GntR family transcriptional regulator [Armatimonadaceae bacterium]